MILAEIKSNGFDRFKDQAVEKRINNISSVQYIELLAQQTGTTISKWDLDDIFGTERGENFITSKTEINRRFFEYKDSKPQQEAAILPKSSEEVVKKLDEMGGEVAKQAISRRKTDVTNRLEQARAAVRDRVANLNEFIRSAQTFQAELNDITEVPPTISADILESCSTGFFKLRRIGKGLIQLTTANDIVLTEKIAKAGVDYSVNLGRILIEIRFGSGMVIVAKPFKDNLFLPDRFFHPYIHCDGGICWGTGASAYSEAAMKFDLKRVLSLLASLLSTYSAEGGPWKALGSFKVQQDLKFTDYKKYSESLGIAYPDKLKEFITKELWDALPLERQNRLSLRSGQWTVTASKNDLDFLAAYENYNTWDNFIAFAKTLLAEKEAAKNTDYEAVIIE